MIDLFTVKRNNTYDFVQDTLPATDGTWLCSLTAGLYTRGHSYQVTSGTATRTEEAQDNLILSRLYPVIENVLAYLNNMFPAKRQQGLSYKTGFEDYYPHFDLQRKYEKYVSDAAKYTYASGVVTNIQDDPFLVDDLVLIVGGIRNNLASYVTAQATGTITLDNSTARDTSENAFIFFVDMPSDVELAVGQMIWWDVYKRAISDKGQETVGNYSYTKQDPTVGGAQYPLEIVGLLDIYKKAHYVA